MLNYVVNSSNKRTPNPLQLPLLMQLPVEENPYFNDRVRRLQQPSGNLKTPTPSAYDLPSSPNVSNVFAPTSDSPDLVDQQSQQPFYQSSLHPAAVAPSSVPSSHNPHQVPTAPSHPSHPHASPVGLTQSQSSHMPRQSDDGSDRADRPMSEEEQQLATKLKETYKNIVNYEEVVQKSCIDITIKINQASAQSTSGMFGQMSTKTSELLNDLWTVYHHNVTLLDNYYDFLVTALKPSANQTQFKTGKNIVDLYKIPRRMWVYGIVGFLEVLKNIINIFQDHEICSCFIAYCFNITSILTDPALEMEGWWCEKLGDLSRMAIALYSSRFIDWKISAEHWYSVSMKTLYGHGKIYYHMCTVQQDNLDALVNIGKSVICRDPFVPTQQYLRLVVENICTQRNILSLLELPLIDFIKIHKVLLSIHTSALNPEGPDNMHDTQLQYGIDLVTRYGLTFGSDSNGYNFFTRAIFAPNGNTGVSSDPAHPYYIQPQHQHIQHQQAGNSNTIEKMNFWFNKGPLFAIANINHLVGFGDAKNPFAKIFQLPEALKERKDKKDRKRKSRGNSTSNPDEIKQLGQSTASMGGALLAGVDGQTVTAQDLSVNDWFHCLDYINKSVLELSLRILNNYLVGPKQALTCHVIVWLYFLIAVGEASSRHPRSQNMFLWLFRKLFPWELLINYLNSLLVVCGNNAKLVEMFRRYLHEHPNYIQHFNENEFLPEVWKCWGTLWFDFIAPKTDYNDVESAGVANTYLFDLPVCGTLPIVNMASTNDKKREQLEHDNDERIVRVLLLARFLADNYTFGLVRTGDRFGFDATIYKDIDLLVSSDPNPSDIPYLRIEEFLFADGRLVQNNFLVPISAENLVDRLENQILPFEKDEVWLSAHQPTSMNEDENLDLGDEVVDEEELEGYADSEFEDDEEIPDPLQQHQFYHQQQHQHAVNQARRIGDDFYTDQFLGTSVGDAIPVPNKKAATIEGDLGDRMDSNITYITLDTNIWLKHCGRIFKCIRNGVFKILIPLIVFQELRLLRKSAEATIADAATRSVIIIRELNLSKEIVPLRFDGTVASDINETTEFENNSNWRTNVDETILNSVNEHDEIGKKLMKGLNQSLNGKPVVLNAKVAKLFRYCVLVTDDRNMRLRAKTIGLTSFQSKWLFTQLETIFGDRCID